MIAARPPSSAVSPRLAALVVILALLPMTALTRPADIDPEPARSQALGIREASLAAQIGATRNRLSRLLGALQRFSRDPPPPLLVPPSEALDSVRAAILIRALTPDLERRAARLRAEARALAVLRRRASAEDGERFAQESAAADLQRVDGLMASQSPSAPLRGPESPPPQLARPTSGEITAAYGGHLASGAPSRGLEFDAAPFAAVVSPTAGLVDYAGPLDGWGRVLIVRGPGGYHIVLAGLDVIIVQPGQTIVSGQPVGLMAGRASPAPRLYLEVRHSDEPVDPAPLLLAIRR